MRIGGPVSDPAAPRAVTGRHLPSLNGLRAVAVLGVMAYHLQFSWASGGYLGVDLFFVLSGFLITSLLLEEWVATAAISLAGFWARRAKRLLPALFLVVAALALYVIFNGTFGGPGANGLIDLASLRGDAISTLLYVGNWHAIYAHQSYFAQFSSPSPLQHTWSLAIEEQFYLVWPLVLLVLLRRAGASWRRIGLAVAVALGLASAGLMALLFHPGVDPTRVYYGTDTRLFDLMAGATVAFLAAARPQPNERARRILHVAGPIAAVVLGVFWVTGGTAAGLPRDFMFEGGFLLCAVLAAVVVADARLVDQGVLGRVLATPPLHFLGTISYGIYLWHWPIFVYLNGARTGLSEWPLDLVRVGLTLAVATASFFLVEQPIRRAQFRKRELVWVAPLAGLVAAFVMVVATIPAVADPAKVVGTTKVVATPGQAVAGAGGYTDETPIRLSAAPSASDPLRVMLLGDSVMHDASFGITASLESTGEVVVYTHTIDGFGLTTATNWPTSLPNLIHQTGAQLIVATWSWDQDGPTTPNALHQPTQYAALLRRAVKVMLTPGNGVEGVVFTQFPPSGIIPGSNPPETAAYNKARNEGVTAWNNIAEEMTRYFPGRVMYLPLASSILLDGHFSTWLPPVGHPNAPADQWIRVRKLDNVHLCPEGSARYAEALLTDMTALFHLAPATSTWPQGAWVSDPNFNNPPGACPDDHPPG
jgi:peptidoglycan/LPS O-acetylase OafA/YrhL